MLLAIHMAVLSTMKKGMDNLDYFDKKKITLFNTKTKIPFKGNKKASNEKYLYFCQ